MFFDWWRKFVRVESRVSRRERRKPAYLRRARFKPWAEVLEGRCLPSTLTVTDLQHDGSAGSLRSAIAQANADAARGISDTIQFQSGGTIVLAQGQLELSGAGGGTITIDGSGLGTPVTISGNNASRVLQVDAGVSATLSGLTITGGQLTGSSAQGGGIDNSGTLTLSGCTVSGNTVAGTASSGIDPGFIVEGGGIYNVGSLTLSGTTVRNNSATGVANSTSGEATALSYGGGIYSTGTLTVTGGAFSGNQATGTATTNGTGSGGLQLFVRAFGGAIYTSGALALTGTTFSANSASASANGSFTVQNSTGGSETDSIYCFGIGGAVYSSSSPLVTIVGSTFTGNTVSSSAQYAHAGTGFDVSYLTGTCWGYAYGGALALDGAAQTLSITGTSFSGNQANGSAGSSVSDTGLFFDGDITNEGEAEGGALFLSSSSGSTLTVSGDTFSGNTASSTGSFGRSGTYYGQVILEAMGSGGAFDVRAGAATVSDSTFTGNTASGSATTNISGSNLDLACYSEAFGQGGALYNGGTLTVTCSQLSGNTASGSAVSSATAGSPALAYGYAQGGAIESEGLLLTVSSSVLSGNNTSTTASGTATSPMDGDGYSTSEGGAIFSHGAATVSDSTLANNTASTSASGTSGGSAASHGGGLACLGQSSTGGVTVQVTNTTISGNFVSATSSGSAASSAAGGGVFVTQSDVLLNNTLVAGNSWSDTTGGGADVSGPVDGASAYNLIGDGGGLSGLSPGSNNNLIGTSAAPLDPLLAPLSNYGGPTQTMALLPGSPAIDAGGSAGAPATDQRGYGRVGAADVGAFESQGFTLASAGGNNQQAQVNTAFANPLAVQLTATNPPEPVNGGVVTFTAPAGGASAILTSTTAAISGGQASVTATANGTAGGYSVTASASGAAGVAFNLTNTEAPSLVVTTAQDGANNADGLTSLREAMSYANSLPGGGKITFDPTVFATLQTITLTSGELDLTNTSGAITIVGPGAGVAISGNHASRVFTIGSGVTAELDNLTIENGYSTTGAGIYNSGNVTVNNSALLGNAVYFVSGGGGASGCGGGLYEAYYAVATVNNSTFSGNTAANYGGAICNGGFSSAYPVFDATVTITNSTLSDNSAAQGGGLFNYGSSTATISDSTITGNSASFGGGIMNSTVTATYTNSTIVTISNSTIADNTATGYGGGIYNEYATLNITNSTFSGNTAKSVSFFDGVGGGIDNYYATASINNSTFSGNTADQYGGGIYNSGNTANLNNSTLSGNTAKYGGGVANGGTVIITNSTLANDTSASYGGGIYNNGTATITNDTLSGNSAASGGGMYNVGSPATVNNSTLVGNTANSGGGIYNKGTANVKNSTLLGNSASYGGGIYNNGTATATNSTIAGNTATYGGAIYNYPYSTATVTNSTIAGNTASTAGGGIYNYNFNDVTKLSNNIVAGNTAGSAPDVYGPLTSLGHNLIGIADGSRGLSNGAGGDQVGTAANPINPLLAPLGNYGGPTQTIALLPGSPAIDAGGSTGAPATDQRGDGRVGAVDIGAFESQGFTLASAGGNNQQAQVNTAFANPLAVQLTANNPPEPVNGGVVTFTAPAGGASAILSSTTVTFSAGQASVTATANGTAGGYSVTASASGAAGLAFSLTNTEAPSMVVTTAQDVVSNSDGLTSLREAMTYANSLPGGTITFAIPTGDPGYNPATGTYTITLASALPALTGAVTIAGPGAAELLVSGAGQYQILAVNAGATVAVSGVTLRDGLGGDGGAIYNAGNLTLADCTLTNNRALYDGGAIASYGVLNATNAVFSSNSAWGQGGALVTGFGTTTTLTGCDFSQNTGGDGGAIHNDTTLTVTDCTFRDNSTQSFGGGGIINFGVATVSASSFTNNQTAGNGGALANYGGTLTVSTSTFTGNADSAIYNTGTLTAAGSSFSGNTGAIFTGVEVDNVTTYTTPVGSGVYNASGGRATVTGSTFSANTGSGIFNYYDPATALPLTQLTVTGCTFSDNQAMFGGGLWVYAGQAQVNSSTFAHNSATSTGGGINNYDGTLAVGSSTFRDNRAGYDLSDQPVSGGGTGGGQGGWGGGIGQGRFPTSPVHATTTVSNSTFSGNWAYIAAGAVFNFYDSLTVTSSTLSRNSGITYAGGIFTVGGTGHVGNSIIAGNSGQSGPDLDGAVVSDGHNLIGSTSGVTGFGVTDLVGVAPRLAPLGNYGGPTQTMALLPGSPAIDAGSNALIPTDPSTGQPFTTDQRGTGYGRIYGASVDIGAFEAQPVTFVVTNTNDGGTGSLRQAILDADALPGTDRITFAIPGSGVQTIAPLSALPTITDPVVLDGYTQAGARPNDAANSDDAVLKIQLDGASLLANSAVLTISGGGSTVRGLSITGILDNAGTGIWLKGQGGNRIQGNFIGLDPAGNAPQGLPNYTADFQAQPYGVHVSDGSSDNFIGSDGNPATAAAERNVISATNWGVILRGFVYGTTSGSPLSGYNVVADNFIGTDPTGTQARGNWAGVGELGMAHDDTVENNLISGNTGGVILGGGSSGPQGGFNCTVTGNAIGLDSQGGVLGNQRAGVFVQIGSSGCTITGNTIADSGHAAGGSTDAPGVWLNPVGGSPTGIRIEGNSIYDNTGLGIDLSANLYPNPADGVTPNDSQGHSGPNNWQNFPSVTSATSSPTDTYITGTFDAGTVNGAPYLPSTTFTLDFYANPAADASGHGQGQVWLGSAKVMTDSNGYLASSPDGSAVITNPNNPSAGFAVDLPVGNLAGQWISATATDHSGNTSEFSKGWQAVFGLIVTNTNDNGIGSLRQAILNANAVAGLDTITFLIPGSGVHTIAPLSALPAITDPVVLDATTQPGFVGAPLVELDGENTGGANGLTIAADGSTVRGLVINRFHDGIDVLSYKNTIQGNSIGLDVTGTQPLGNTGDGIRVMGAGANTISGNTLSGNGQDGVDVVGGAAASGAVSWWQAEGNAQDATGSNNGNLVGNVTFVPGVSGTAFDFDGSSYVDIPSNANLEPTQQITMGGWIKPVFAGRPVGGADVDTIIDKRPLPLGYGLYLAMDPTFAFGNAPPGGAPLGTPIVDLDVNGQFYQLFGSAAVPDDGQFHYVAATYDGGRIVLYLDGQVIASAAASGAISEGVGQDARIGSVNDGRGSRAAIDEVAVFDRALTSGEIQAIYNARGAGAGLTGNQITGNFIGTDADGTVALGNGGDGIRIENGAGNNRVANDVIAYNTGTGVAISGGATAGNTIEGDSISHNQNSGISNDGGTLTVSSCTITDNSGGKGGGVYNMNGTLTVSDCTLSGNTASTPSASSGGGIYNQSATLTITGSTLTGNSAGYEGGGIANLFGTLTVTSSRLTGNSAPFGGGIHNYEATTSVTGSTLSNNSGYDGGGLDNWYGGTVTVMASTLSGNSATNGGGIFGWLSTATVTGSTLSGNSASSNGGAIDSDGGTSTLTVLGSTLSDNTAAYGGGISNRGSLTVSTSTFADDRGGGIYNTGTLTVRNTTFTGNTGATYNGVETNGTPFSTPAGSGVYNDQGGTAQVGAATFADNTGSAIFNSDDPATASAVSTVVVGDSTFAGNEAGFGAGIANVGGLVQVDHSTFTGNAAGGFALSGGGAIDNFGGGGTLVIRNSTFVGNRAGYDSAGNQLSGGGYGGGIVNYQASMTVTNSTFVDNCALNYGGGIFNFQATLTVTNDTLAGNSAAINGGGGLFCVGSGTIGNTIIAQNSAPAGPDVYGAVASNGSNLIGTGSGVSGFGRAGDQVGVTNPGLAPLDNYGGPTQTIALLPGSPAIDAGSNALATAAGLTTDQRGDGRLGAVDIGAFESQGFTLTVSGGNNQDTVIGSAFANPLAVQVTANNPAEPVDGGQVTFTAPASGASAILSSSTATIGGGRASVTATANATAGSYSVSATAAGAVGTSFSLTNDKAATTTAVGSSLNPSTYGQTVTFSATVTNTSSGIAPTGAVEFFDTTANTDLGAGTPGPASGNSTTWTFATAALSAGSHAIGAVFGGDANFIGSTGTVAQTVKPALLAATADNQTITYGDPVPVLTYTYTGLVNGDSAAAFTGALATAASAGSSAGTYAITQGTLAATGNYTIAAFTAGTLTINQATPFFSAIVVTPTPPITVGTSSVTLSGTLSYGSLIPTGSVTVALDGVSQGAVIGAGGSFSGTFDTSTLAVGVHSIRFSYGGDQNFTDASASGTLDDTYGILVVSNKMHGHNSVKIQIELTTASNQDVSASGTTVTALGIAATADTADPTGAIDPSQLGSLMTAQSVGGSNPTNVFSYNSGTKSYSYDLQIPQGLQPGTYRVYFSVAGDPLDHWVTFTVA